MENFNNAQAMKDTDNAIAIEGMTTSEIALQGSITHIDFENNSATTPVVGTSTQLVVGTSTTISWSSTQLAVGTSTETAGTSHQLDVGTSTATAGTRYRLDVGTSTTTTGTRTQLSVGTSTTTADTSTQLAVSASNAIAGKSTENNEGKRKHMGRQKIKMEKIENQANLQVAFSKRKKCVFKKAHELSIMTGADVAAIIFSPSRKVYSYGSPNLERVIDRFTTEVDRPLTHPEATLQNWKNRKVLEGNVQLEELLKQMEAEKKRGEWLDQQLVQAGPQSWIPTENKSVEDLQRSAEMLKRLSKAVDKEIEKQSMHGDFMFYHGLGISPPMHAANPAAYARGNGSSSGSGGFFQFTPGDDGSVGAGVSGAGPYGQRFYGRGSSRGGFSFGGHLGVFNNVGSSSRPFIEGPSPYLGGVDGSGDIGSSSGVGADVIDGVDGNNGGVGSGGEVFSSGGHLSACNYVGSSRGPFTVDPSFYLGHAGGSGSGGVVGDSGSDDVNVFDGATGGSSSANALGEGGYSGINIADLPGSGSADIAGFSADMDDGFPDMDSVFAEIARSSGRGPSGGMSIREGAPRTSEPENSILYGSKAKVIDWSDLKPPGGFGRER